MGRASAAWRDLWQAAPARAWLQPCACVSAWTGAPLRPPTPPTHALSLAPPRLCVQDQQVIELVTGLLAQDKVTPEQAATILQQMLPPGTLSQLQAHLTTPRGAEEGRYR